VLVRKLDLKWAMRKGEMKVFEKVIEKEAMMDFLRVKMSEKEYQLSVEK